MFPHQFRLVEPAARLLDGVGRGLRFGDLRGMEVFVRVLQVRPLIVQAGLDRNVRHDTARQDPSTAQADRRDRHAKLFAVARGKSL